MFKKEEDFLKMIFLLRGFKNPEIFFFLFINTLEDFCLKALIISWF